MEDQKASSECGWFINALTPTALNQQPNQPGSYSSIDSQTTTEQQLLAAAPQRGSHPPCGSIPVGAVGQAGARRSLFGAPTRTEVDGFLGQLEAQLREQGKLTCPG
jgi:hypothetical protein